MSTVILTIFGCFIGAFVGAAVAYIADVANRRKTASTPPIGFCKASEHTLIPIDARTLKSEQLAYPHTIVLHRCSRCGLHTATTFAGEWTIDDFLKKEADMNWLERAAK